MSKVPVIAGATVGPACAVIMAVAIFLLARWWKLRPKPPVGKYSQTALLKMGASSGDAFRFDLDNAGRLNMLGEGGFGEVQSPSMCAQIKKKGLHCKGITKVHMSFAALPGTAFYRNCT